MKAKIQIPLATYRLQFNREFTFRDAAAIVPYLAELGITHCYASPYLRARPGSMHGYDIIDHNSLNPEIGTQEDFDCFVGELRRHGMGQILDIVPNHMGVMGSDNSWWLDVLENGEASDYADFFDIDWDPIKDELQGKVLVPILGDQYGNVLEQGELKLAFDAELGQFSIFYHHHRFPVDPAEYPRILGMGRDGLKEKIGGESEESVLELQSISTAFSNLPNRRGLTADKRAERNREKEIQKRRLAALCSRAKNIREFISGNVRLMNGTVGDTRSFDPLHELIKAQAYRLAQWRVAADDINYRRFFDINDLAAVRMESDEAFRSTHRFVLDLVARHQIDGLRIDHPDGLYDPRGYFNELQCGMPCAESPSDASRGRRIYVVVEKILSRAERLRKDWPVHGTTGYEFTNLLNGIFVDTAADARMERIYRSFTGREVGFDDLVYDCKKLILKISLASELNVLANALSRIALSNRHTCDFTVNSLRSALAEIIASFPVYRTYVRGHELTPDDRRYIDQAVAAGRKRSNAADLSVFDFINRVLLAEASGDEPQWYRNAVVRFAMKFQQVTSAVMAKGLEDTAFYRYNRLVSLNEVGGDPGHFGVTLDEFHRANQRRLQCWPHSMLATSTHDSKRSEDVRARIDILSEIPAQWRLSIRHWRDWNRSRKRLVDGNLAPSRNDEYLLYQTLVGAWPFGRLNDAERNRFTDRIVEYMLKAVREAKEFTSWANPNESYEMALTSFIRSVLEPRRKNRFLPDFLEFQSKVSRWGMLNSLSQTLLKLTSPGVPDIYQGNEIWDFSLVDPDNRRPVDYRHRRYLLDALRGRPIGDRKAETQAEDLLRHLENGHAKLLVTCRTLHCRKRYRELFETGQYMPLAARNAKASNVCAFLRQVHNEMALVIVPRLVATLLSDKKEFPLGTDAWGDTRLDLPENASNLTFRNVFTDEMISVQGGGEGMFFAVSSLLERFPVALLVAEPSI